MSEPQTTSSPPSGPRFRVDYDRLPYGSRPLPFAHPDRLYVAARRGQLDITHPARARFLEIGCAEGGHVIPLASRDPEAHFVAVDASETQIELGREMSDRLGLENLELVHADVAEWDPEGAFDYVHCHGVLSWVDEARRGRILSVIGEHLAPSGVALLSHNVRAGWGIRDNLRRALLRRVRDVAHPSAIVDHVRSLLGFFAQQPLDDASYGKLLVEQARAALRQSDAYLVHEFLSPDNQPLARSEVVERAAAHGLAPFHELTEAVDSSIESDVREVLAGFTDDALEQDDLFDLLTGRPFRVTLFRRADAPLRELDWLAGVAYSGRLRPEAPRPSLEPGDTEFFKSPLGARVAVDAPWLKAALLTLGSLDSAALPEDVLFEGARRLLVSRRVIEDAPIDADERAALRVDLGHLVDLRHVDVRARPFLAPATLGACPRAATLTRLEARTRPWVSDALHRPVKVDRVEASILHLLDGSRSLEAIVTMLDTALDDRDVPLADKDGEPLEAERREEFLYGFVREALSRFARLGLVV